MKARVPAFAHPIAVATLHGENHLKLAPDAAARARIARELGLHAIDTLGADLHITHANNGLISIAGTLEATLWPICVVSLDPFRQVVSEQLALRLAPPDLVARQIKRAENDGVEDFEPPDTIVDGMIDVGQIVVEFLALALDPYPRKPGAEFAGGDPAEPRISPFDALKALTPKDGAA